MLITEDEFAKLCPVPAWRAATPVAVSTPAGKLYWIKDIRNFALRGCAYIHGDTRAYWQYCNHPTLPGKSWCAEHYALVTVQRSAVVQALQARARTRSGAVPSLKSASERQRFSSQNLDQLLSRLLAEL